MEQNLKRITITILLIRNFLCGERNGFDTKSLYHLYSHFLRC